MLLLALAATSLWTGAERDWRAYDVGAYGVGDSAIRFDTGRLERHGARILVWSRYELHYSGRNDTTHDTRFEIDCARRMARAIAAYDHPPIDFRRWRARPPRPVREAFKPIDPDSHLASLAERVCDGAIPARVSPWVDLPEPAADAELPRFSYDPAVRRWEGRVRVWIRYWTIDQAARRQLGPDSRMAEIESDELIELDCTARTQRRLDRLVLHFYPRRERTQAAATPIAAGTREAVVAERVCETA